MFFLPTATQWAHIAPLLPGRAGTRGGRGQANRRFVEAVRWLTRNGCRWRALPAEWEPARDVHALPALDRLRRVGAGASRRATR